VIGQPFASGNPNPLLLTGADRGREL